MQILIDILMALLYNLVIMKNIFLISDPHFGHAGVCRFTRDDGSKLRPWDNPDDMDEALIKNWNSVVQPQDKVYVLGDVVMSEKKLHILGRLNGSKRLIRGNHDIYDTKKYLEYFKEIYGCRVLEDMILSHIPLFKDCITERFQTCVHGHLHYRTIDDPAYYNVCVENIDYTPIEISVLRERIRAHKQGWDKNGNKIGARR